MNFVKLVKVINRLKMLYSAFETYLSRDAC